MKFLQSYNLPEGNIKHGIMEKQKYKVNYKNVKSTDLSSDQRNN